MSRPVNAKVLEAAALVGTPYERRKESRGLPPHTATSAALQIGVDPQALHRYLRQQASAKASTEAPAPEGQCSAT